MKNKLFLIFVIIFCNSPCFFAYASEDFNFDIFKHIIVLDQFSDNPLDKKVSCDLIVSGGKYGFDDREMKIISKNRACSFNLGENILRAETAPLVALSRLNI